MVIVMGNGVRISQRLQALCRMVTPGNAVVDVGCDHALAAIYLVQRCISPRVIAMDVGKGPLSRAAEHIAQYSLEAYIETRLSDGLSAYEAGEAASLICAGMGGRLMSRILTQGHEKAKTLQELILQPQSELAQFRRFLRQSGYAILAEDILQEEGKYYFLMKASYAGEELAAKGWGELSGFPDMELSDRYGGLLLQEGNPVLKRYLEDCLDIKCKIADGLGGTIKKRGEACRQDEACRKLQEVETEIECLRRALAYYDEHDFAQGG